MIKRQHWTLISFLLSVRYYAKLLGAFYLSLYNWYTECTKLNKKQEMALISCLETWFVFPFSAAPWYCLQILLFFYLLIIKNKSHFGHYDPLPSVSLTPVVGKGGVGNCFCFLYLLLTVSCFLSFPVCWGRRGGARPFAGLVLLWSTH